MDAAEVYTVALAVFAGVLAVVAVAHAILGLPRPPGLDKLAWALEVGLAARVMLAIGSIAGGDRPDNLTTHVGYLVTAVAVLPIILSVIRDDRERWTNGVLAVGLVTVVVVAVRLQLTTAHG